MQPPTTLKHFFIDVPECQFFQGVPTNKSFWKQNWIYLSHVRAPNRNNTQAHLTFHIWEITTSGTAWHVVAKSKQEKEQPHLRRGYVDGQRPAKNIWHPIPSVYTVYLNIWHDIYWPTFGCLWFTDTGKSTWMPRAYASATDTRTCSSIAAQEC